MWRSGSWRIYNKATVVQWDRFLHGLADRIQKEIFDLDLPTSLDALIELAIYVDNRLKCCDQRTRQFSFPSADSSNVTVSHILNPESMQVGRTRLTMEEKDCRRRMDCVFIVERLVILLPISQ